MASAISLATLRGSWEPESMQLRQASKTRGARRVRMTPSLKTSLPKMAGMEVVSFMGSHPFKMKE